MKFDKIILIASIANFALLTFGAFLLPSLMPVHINWQLRIDVMASTYFLIAFGAIPIIFALITYFVNMKPANKTCGIVLGTITCFLIYFAWVAYYIASSNFELGDILELSPAIVLGIPLSIILLISSLYVPMLKQEKSFGIRTVNTLVSEKNWERTHSFTGLVFFVLGLLLCTMCFVSYVYNAVLVFLISLALVIILAFALPYLFSLAIGRKSKAN